MGMDIFTVPLHLSKENYTQLNIWDIGGSQRFESIRPTFYRGAQGFIAVVDITRYETFEHLEKWITEVQKMVGKSLPGNILANKVDLEEFRAVKFQGDWWFCEKSRPLCLPHIRPWLGKTWTNHSCELARKIHKGVSGKSEAPTMQEESQSAKSARAKKTSANKSAKTGKKAKKIPIKKAPAKIKSSKK